MELVRAATMPDAVNYNAMRCAGRPACVHSGGKESSENTG